LLLKDIQLVVELVGVRENCQLQELGVFWQGRNSHEVSRDPRYIKLVGSGESDLIGRAKGEDVRFNEDTFCPLKKKVVAIQVYTLEASIGVLAEPLVREIPAQIYSSHRQSDVFI
jgi:hypothetical protein